MHGREFGIFHLEHTIIRIVDEAVDGITRRGIFYKVVSMGFFTSTAAEYYKSGMFKTCLDNLRLSERLNEDNILDATRIRSTPAVWLTAIDFLESIKESYRQDLWGLQPIRVEVFSEKDAMSPVLSSVCREYRVTYNMIRGYSSKPIIYRIGKEWPKVGKPILVLYVGDHDPSGKDIESDLQARLKVATKLDIGWQRIAATKADIEKYRQYLLPLKASDTRSAKYLKAYGEYGIEVDAVDTSEMKSRLVSAIEAQIDKRAWAKALAAEKKQLGEIQRRIDLD